MRLYWQFVPNKKRAILFMSFQALSRLLFIASPYFFANILNALQIQGPTMWNTIYMYTWLLFGAKVVEWIFHGPSRVREMQLAFQTERAYQLYLYHAAISLPLEWHTNNHSWETIDRINKSKDSLSNFAWSLYSYLGTYISFAGAIIALSLIWPTILPVVIAVGLIVMRVIRKFDVKIVAWIK